MAEPIKRPRVYRHDVSGTGIIMTNDIMTSRPFKDRLVLEVTRQDQGFETYGHGSALSFAFYNDYDRSYPFIEPAHEGDLNKRRD